MRNCGRGIFVSSSAPGTFVVGTIDAAGTNNLYGVLVYNNARVTVRIQLFRTTPTMAFGRRGGRLDLRLDG